MSSGLRMKLLWCSVEGLLITLYICLTNAGCLEGAEEADGILAQLNANELVYLFRQVATALETEAATFEILMHLPLAACLCEASAKTDASSMHHGHCKHMKVWQMNMIQSKVSPADAVPDPARSARITHQLLEVS